MCDGTLVGRLLFNRWQAGQSQVWTNHVVWILWSYSFLQALCHEPHSSPHRKECEVSPVVQIWGTGAVAREKEQDIPPGSTSSRSVREKHCGGKGTSTAALRNLVKTYCSGERGGTGEKTQLYSLRKDKITSWVPHNSWGSGGRTQAPRPRNLKAWRMWESEAESEPEGILSSSSPLNAKLRPLRNG